MIYHKLPADLGQALLNYLASKPYAEVHRLIAALQALPECESTCQE